jgi:hypothetical protein
MVERGIGRGGTPFIFTVDGGRGVGELINVDGGERCGG